MSYSSLKNGTNRNQTIEKTVPDVKGSSCPYEIGTVMFRQCKKVTYFQRGSIFSGSE